ncbi:MAG: sigma-70 family RNA polymerase sigma factor [Acidobacteriaceae bacterium]|nr:sigma-70 family RNA polymerase sigma factor [Acidobacteriaceae bacterium]
MVGLASIAALLPSDGDAGLIARLKRRDPGAMGDLYDRFGKVTFALIVHIVKSREVAEDLLAETFLKAWNRSTHFPNDSASLGLWILSMGRNHALDYLRARSGRSEAVDSTLEALERPHLFVNFGPEHQPLDRLTETEQSFARLATDERRVLELAYFEGFTPIEIAARMQQPPSVIKTSLGAAMEKLRHPAAPAHVPDSVETNPARREG